MLLIGSRATLYHYSDARAPKDYDFLATKEEVDFFLSFFKWKDTSSHEKKLRARVKLDDRFHSFEFDLVEYYPSSKLILDNDKMSIVNDNLLHFQYHVASPATLLLLKKSHITFNIHWWKNIYDYLYLNSKGIKINAGWEQQAYDLRYNEILNRANRKQMNFDVENSEFFKKSEKFVNRVVEHDSLHYATCFYEEPLFLLAKDRKSTRLNSSHIQKSRMPSSA